MSQTNIQKYQAAMFELLQNNRFYGELLLECQVILDFKFPPKTPGKAAATSRNGIPTILFDADFVKELSVKGLKGVIKHELQHIVLDHTQPHKFGNTSEVGGLIWSDDILWNIAQDCMINQECDGIEDVKSKVTLDDVSKILGYKLDPWQTSQYYFDHLKQLANEKRKELMEKANFDAHEFSDPDGDSEMEAKSGIFNAINKAVKKCAKAGNESIPKEALEALNALKSQMEQPWESLLANFIAKTISSQKISTRKRLNKRYGTLVPGYKRIKELTLALCIDESGSMSDDDIGRVAYQVLELMTKAGVLHIIHADTEITLIETVKKGDKFEYKRASSGGTAYGPAINKAAEMNVDAIIYFGDMDAFDTPTDPGIPVLWITTSENTKRPGDFGEIIRLR